MKQKPLIKVVVVLVGAFLLVTALDAYSTKRATIEQSKVHSANVAQKGDTK